MSVDTNPEIGPIPEARGEGIWTRGLYMLLFVLIYGVAEFVVAAVVIVQFGWVVLGGEMNDRLRSFGASLSEFVYQIVAYFTFTSEVKPYPFSDWPNPRKEEGL